jgi:hypothetical protein
MIFIKQAETAREARMVTHKDMAGRTLDPGDPGTDPGSPAHRG